MASPRDSIAILNPEHKLFILGEEDLKPNYFLVWHRVQVQMGEKWLLFRDGALYRKLEPGPHLWWNGFMHKWKAQRISSRVDLLPLSISGRVKGPQMQETPGAEAVDLGCDVTAGIEITCGIAIIENFLRYSDPLSVFVASIGNIVVEEIGKLPYDQYGSWATELRDRVRRRLMRDGSDDAERVIGIRVENVYITGFKPNSERDRNMLLMYRQVEKARRELAEAQANTQRDATVARSFAQQGDILNIAPSILALQNSPVGKVLIERDASLRELMVTAGLTPGVNVQPLPDPNAPSGSMQSTAGLYLNPLPRASEPLAITSGDNPTQSPPPPPPQQATGPAVDLARKNAELIALQNAGFVPAGRGKDVPSFDAQGQMIPGSNEWALQVSIERSPDRHLMIVFYCPAGYPAYPPRVQIRPPEGGSLRPIEPNSVKNWHIGSMLVDIANEINQDTY